jgi:hypothetical protein
VFSTVARVNGSTRRAGFGLIATQGLSMTVATG